MAELWNGKDGQFAQTQQYFGVSLLQDARQMAMEPTPETEDQHPDVRLSDAAQEAFERLLDHVAALSEDKQGEALTMIAYGMIMEYLRLASRTPRA
jgi:hypothetical protein